MVSGKNLEYFPPMVSQYSYAIYWKSILLTLDQLCYICYISIFCIDNGLYLGFLICSFCEFILVNIMLFLAICHKFIATVYICETILFTLVFVSNVFAMEPVVFCVNFRIRLVCFLKKFLDIFASYYTEPIK